MFLNRNFLKKTLTLNILTNSKFLISIITQIILTKYLESTIFGKFAIILFIVDIIFSLTVVDQQAIIKYQYKKSIIFTSEILCNYFSNILFFISLVFFLIVFHIKNFSLEFLIVAFIIIISRWIKYRLIISEANLEKKLQYEKIYLYYFINSLISNIACLVLLYFDYGIIALATREIIDSISHYALLKHKQNKLKNKFNFNIAKIIIKFSLQNAFINILNIFQFRAIYLFLGIIFSSANLVGVFERASFFIFAVSNFFSQVLDRIFVPLISKKNSHKIKNYFMNIFFIYKIFIFFPIGVLTFFFGEKFIVMLFGANWSSTGEIVSILSFWLIFNNLYQILERWIFLKKTKVFSIISSLISFFSILIAALYLYYHDNRQWTLFAWALNVSSLINLLIAIFLSVKIKQTYFSLKPIIFSIIYFLFSFLFFYYLSNLNYLLLISIYFFIYFFLIYLIFKNSLFYLIDDKTKKQTL
jgi:O-antigen/teichoic acid export membrane protein